MAELGREVSFAVPKSRHSPAPRRQRQQSEVEQLCGDRTANGGKGRFAKQLATLLAMYSIPVGGDGVAIIA
jgi:hypothetical protein